MSELGAPSISLDALLGAACGSAVLWIAGVPAPGRVLALVAVVLGALTTTSDEVLAQHRGVARGRPSPTPAAEGLRSTWGGEPGPVRVSHPAPWLVENAETLREVSAASGRAIHLAPLDLDRYRPTRPPGSSPQCPVCGSLELIASSAGWRCEACHCRVAGGRMPWPDVRLNPRAQLR